MDKLFDFFKKNTSGFPFILFVIGGLAVGFFLFIFRSYPNFQFDKLMYVIVVSAFWVVFSDIAKKREIINRRIHFIIDSFFYLFFYSLIIYFTGGYNGGLFFIFFLAAASAPIFGTIAETIIFLIVLSFVTYFSHIVSHLALKEPMDVYHNSIVTLQSVFYFIIAGLVKYFYLETEKRRQQYYDLIENTPLCIKVFDNKGNLIFINKGGREEHFLKDTDDITKWNWVDTVEKRYQSIAEKEFAKALNGESVSFVIRHTPEGSKYEWCSSTISPVKDKDGNIVSILFYSTNITDLEHLRLGLEEKVREQTESLKKFELAVENSDNHIIITDSDGLILYANKAAEEMTGYSKSEILGKKPSLWGKQMDLEFYKNLWHIIKDEKKVFVGEIRNRKKTGEIYIVEAHIVPLLDEGGKLKFFVSIEHDITKEKEIEKMRSDFLSLASHQLRTPLSGIKWQIETMQRGVIGSFTKKQKEYLNNIHNINEKMIQLVFDMLNVLKIESGKVEFKKEDVSTEKIFDELLIYGDSIIAEKKKISIHGLPKDYENITINTDIQVLETILESFLSNAVNYSRSGQEVIFDIKEEGESVIFSIKDSGIGIPKDEQRKIFERFYRADNAKNYKPDGTGLGLYIAFMLAEKIDGKVWFESEENKGSTFYLSIPKRSDKKIINQ